MRIKSKGFSIIFKLIILIVAVISVMAQIGIFDGEYNFKVLTMFTLVSNILCILYFTIDIIYLLISKNKEKTTFSPIIKGIITTCITVTFLTAQFVLKMPLSFDTMKNASFLGVHYIVPIMTILDYFLFNKKGKDKWYYPVVWLIFPYLYSVIAYVTAKFANGIGANEASSYPYSFMDINKLGVVKVSNNLLIMAAAFLLLGYVFLGIDKLLGIKKEKQ